ncbi:MAG: hypothetical protein JWL85_64 [Candidatus Saccharibacteria bacterium]|nr:hypothetical protein [Candidatus Saccharibacteria bacterium]
MNTITCKKCGEEIEISAALQGQIEAQVLAAEHKKHEAELAKVRTEASELAKKQLDNEKEILAKQAESELEMVKKRLESEAASALKKTTQDQEMIIKNLRDDAASEKESNKELREKLTELMQELRVERKAKENVEIEMQKKLTEEEGKIRESAAKEADEKQRLNLAARDKTIADLQKALDDAQRKAAQGSQQLQGEIMELDFETTLTNAFRDDDIEPVAKGVKGSDIKHTVKSPRGTACGVMLWEIKRTKNWVDGWIPKLKEDLRNEKANIPIIITEVMPKSISEDIGQYNGVWVCKPQMAVVLASLLRKGLLDAGLQKALAQNRGTKADALYNFITSHEFVQQVEAMVETYQEMTLQITKERTYYAKFWAEREAQTQRLLLGTANIIGSMQGHVGHAAMPRIKGLELLEAGEE